VCGPKEWGKVRIRGPGNRKGGGGTHRKKKVLPRVTEGKKGGGGNQSIPDERVLRGKNLLKIIPGEGTKRGEKKRTGGAGRKE